MQEAEMEEAVKDEETEKGIEEQFEGTEGEEKIQ